MTAIYNTSLESHGCWSPLNIHLAVVCVSSSCGFINGLKKAKYVAFKRLIDSTKYINSACFLIENNRIKVKIAKRADCWQMVSIFPVGVVNWIKLERHFGVNVRHFFRGFGSFKNVIGLRFSTLLTGQNGNQRNDNWHTEHWIKKIVEMNEITYSLTERERERREERETETYIYADTAKSNWEFVLQRLRKEHSARPLSTIQINDRNCLSHPFVR